MAPQYEIVRYEEIDVLWLPELDGGGRYFGQDFLPVVQHLFGRPKRVFEFCAGPGFIGFSLLAHGLCDALVLADVNPAAVAAAEATVARNGLEDRVTVYRSEGLSQIPDGERWDLVVSNPPHFGRQRDSTPSLITDDLDWRLHREFYGAVARFLAPGGSVLLQENEEGSDPGEFLPMIAEGGLRHVQTLRFTAGAGGPGFYYLWSQVAVPGLECSRT